MCLYANNRTVWLYRLKTKKHSRNDNIKTKDGR